MKERSKGNGFRFQIAGIRNNRVRISRVQLYLFFQSMASKSYEAGFKRYYGNRLDNISNKTTEEEIKRLYDDWAGEYEEVINMYTWYHPRRPLGC